MSVGVLQIHGWYGDTTALPAARMLSSELFAAATDLDLGVGDTGEVDLPAEMLWGEREVLKGPAETVEAVALVVAVFAGTTASEWAFEKVLDALWQRTRSAWRRLAKDARDSSAKPGVEPQSAVIQTYHETQDVVVEVWIPLGTDVDPDLLVDQAIETQKSARGDVALGPSHRLIRYHVQRDLTVTTEIKKLDQAERPHQDNT